MSILTQTLFYMNSNILRNDIVGHPTHRTYQDGGTFSILKTDSTLKIKLFMKPIFTLKIIWKQKKKRLILKKS